MCINAWVTSLDRKLRPFGSGWGGDPRLEQGSGEGRSHRGLVLFSRLHLRLCIPNSSEPSLRRTESREPQAMGCRKRRFWWREVRAGGAGSNPARGDHCWGSWQPGSSEPSKDAKKGGRGQRGGAKENCLAGPVCQACCPRPRPTALEPVPPLSTRLALPATHTAKALPSRPVSSCCPRCHCLGRDVGQWTGLETLCVAATPEERVLALIFQEVADSWGPSRLLAVTGGGTGDILPAEQ